MSKHRLVFGLLGLAAAGVALGVLARRSIAARPHLPSAPAPLSSFQDLPDDLDELPPDSSIFDPPPVSERDVSARPHAFARRLVSADDYDAISADDLGAAFLARATDSSAPTEDYGDDAEEDGLVGFQILQPRRP